MLTMSWLKFKPLKLQLAKREPTQLVIPLDLYAKHQGRIHYTAFSKNELIDLIMILCSMSGLLEKTQSGSNLAAFTPKYHWIRIALFEKRLQKIVAHLVAESDK